MKDFLHFFTKEGPTFGHLDITLQLSFTACHCTSGTVKGEICKLQTALLPCQQTRQRASALWGAAPPPYALLRGCRSQNPHPPLSPQQGQSKPFPGAAMRMRLRTLPLRRGSAELGLVVGTLWALGVLALGIPWVVTAWLPPHPERRLVSPGGAEEWGESTRGAGDHV